MVDRVKLLVGLLSSNDEPHEGRVTMFEVAAMLDALGEEHRVHTALLVATP